VGPEAVDGHEISLSSARASALSPGCDTSEHAEVSSDDPLHLSEH
jgi:hypothetical protein